MIIRFADGADFVIEDVQPKEVMTENVRRPGLAISVVAGSQKELLDLWGKFDEDNTEPLSTLTVYHHESDPRILAMALAEPEDVEKPSSQQYVGYEKISSAQFDKYQIADPNAAGTLPTEEPKHGWRLTVEIGQLAHTEL